MKVIDFCHAFDHPVIDNITNNSNLTQENGNEYIRQNDSLSKLRYDLIHEEIEELTYAVNTNDVVEVIDALCDILYVVYGAGISFGVNLDTHFKKHIRSQMIENGNIFNSVDFEGTNFTILKSICNPDNGTVQELFKRKVDFLTSSIVILNSQLTDFKAAIDNNQYMGIIKPLTELTYTTYLIGLTLNIDLDRGFDIVHNSNMSKLCSTEAEAKLTVNNYIENDGRYDSPSYKSGVGDYYVVYNKSSGKILKSINYTPAKFDSMLC